MRFVGHDLDLSPSFFGVKTIDTSTVENRSSISSSKTINNDDSDNDNNSTTVVTPAMSAVSNIEHLKLVVLHFRAPQPTEWNFFDMAEWERSVGNYITK